MLLVDHDQPEIARPARRPPIGGRRRCVASPGRRRCHSSRRSPRGEPRVEQGDAVAEARREAADGLRRERDLGHQHDRAAPALERRLGGGEVDLGLAGAGDAVQQELACSAPSSAATIAPSARRCCGAELRPAATGRADRGRSTGGARRSRRAQARPGRAPRGASGSRASTPRRPRARRPGAHAGARPRPAASSAARWRRRAGCRRPGPRARPSVEPRPAARAAGRTPRPPRPMPGRQHQLQPAGRGRAVLPRHPQAEPHELRRRPRLERVERLGQALGRQLARLGHLDHDAEHRAAPERAPRATLPTPTPASRSGSR